MEYPEHEKMQKVSERSQACGEFIEWLGGKGICLASYQVNEHGVNELFSVNDDIQKLLAEFFEIDLQLIQEEKEQMFEALRKAAQVG